MPIPSPGQPWPLDELSATGSWPQCPISLRLPRSALMVLGLVLMPYFFSAACAALMSSRPSSALRSGVGLITTSAALAGVSFTYFLLRWLRA